MVTKVKRTKIAVFIVIILVVVTSGILFALWQGRRSNLNDVDAVVSKVNKHYVLPVDETPALATVEDKTKVNSEFLRVSENGDKLLIYKNAKKVILYRPSIDRVVEVGPVSIADPSG